MTPALNSDVLSPVRVPVAVALMCLPMRLLPEELGSVKDARTLLPAGALEMLISPEPR
jgi:hypothetical protein